SGLNHIAANSPVEADYLLLDQSFRKRCIQSFYTFFKEFFIVKCTPYLYTNFTKDYTKLNGVCRCWWNNIPVKGNPQDVAYHEIDMEFLDVINQTLHLPLDICSQSALNGLAVWSD